MKLTLAPRLSVFLALLALMSTPTHLLAQTAADTVPPQADINIMPKWSEFPVPPTDITTDAEYKTDVSEALGKRKQLRTEVRALVWDNTVPENFTEARDRIDPALKAPIETQTTPAQINALADELRKRAAPPPVVK